MDRILNVLVRYFDDEMTKVVTQHFGTRMVNIADASSLTNALQEILQSYNLRWDQVTSILLDNCSVMRGKRSGVETQIRQLNPYLLDISGDTVHMVSNAAKALLGSFQNYVEDFCMDVYYDIEKFPKQKELFGELQSLLHMKKKSLIRPISSRFLQMLEVCNRVRALVDPLIAHYYSFLSPDEQHKYRWLLNQVQQQHGVTSDEKARMTVLQQQLGKGQSDTNTDTKKRICVLFSEFNKLTTTIDIYRGILPSFQVFLKKLQHDKPMLHILHVEKVLLVRDVLSKFMKHDAIPLDVDSLLNLDVHNRDLQYPDKLLSVGKFSHFAVNKARLDKKPWVRELYKALREGYTKAAVLVELVKALLSVFTGPLVEGSFNIMDDIIEKDRVRLSTETYEGFAIIKSHLKAVEQTPSTMTISADLRRSCLSHRLKDIKSILSTRKKNNDEKERKIKEALKVLSAVRVKKVKQAVTSHPPISAFRQPTTSKSTSEKALSISTSSSTTSSIGKSTYKRSAAGTHSTSTSRLSAGKPFTSTTSPGKSSSKSIPPTPPSTSTGKSSSKSTAPLSTSTGKSKSTTPPSTFTTSTGKSSSKRAASLSTFTGKSSSKSTPPTPPSTSTGKSSSESTSPFTSKSTPSTTSSTSTSTSSTSSSTSSKSKSTQKRVLKLDDFGKK
ncbi:hypothetical protein ACEWY4_024505 [Coilia grayii]|uniref:DUF4371 domain-containing protein n=1 Tax=Coilia grayii TaxID=363190 RepID=A0ABD1J0W8_9TELE